MEHYLSKQPMANDRVEFAMATLCAMFFNANRGQGQPVKNVKDYLPFIDPWPSKDGRYSDLDKEVLGTLLNG